MSQILMMKRRRTMAPRTKTMRMLMKRSPGKLLSLPVQTTGGRMCAGGPVPHDCHDLCPVPPTTTADSEIQYYY